MVFGAKNVVAGIIIGFLVFFIQLKIHLPKPMVFCGHGRNRTIHLTPFSGRIVRYAGKLA